MKSSGLGVLLLAAFVLGASALLPQDASASSYIANDTLHNLTFSNLTAMQQSSSSISNLTYPINITNYGNATENEQYNLSVVDCANPNQGGVGALSTDFLNLTQNASAAVNLYVSNSTAGVYSSCIRARHWNGSETESSWNLTSSADGVNLSSSFYPDLAPAAVYWISAGGNLFVYNATIANSGDFNFPGNMSVSLFWDGVLNQNVTVQNSSLANGTSYNVSFTNITGIANGLHNFTVQVDRLNNVTETNEANNNYTANVSVLGYTVTVLSVAAQNGTNTAPSRNVTINVSVKYENGANVTNLNKDNFTVYDFSNGTVRDVWNSQDALFNSSFNNSGVYWFTISSIPSVNNTDTYPGVHNITVQVSNSESGNAYSGNSSGNDYYYLIVPRLVVTLTAPSGLSLNEGGTRAITVNISNTGTDTIYNVSITATDDSDYLTVPSAPSCTTASLNNGSYLACPSLFSAAASEVSDAQYPTITVTAYGVHNYSGSPLLQYTREGFIQLTINNVASGTTGDTGDGGGGTTTRSCTTDTNCRDNESCVSRVCTAISCPNGEIMDHFCIQFNYKINITSSEPELSVLSGESGSTKVTVKNTGGKTFTAKLEASLGGGITVTVSPASYSLDAGESYQFAVNFTVPNTTTIGNFTGTFKAYVSASTDFYDSKTIKLVVLPSEETKASINLSYQELRSQFANLSVQFAQMKASGRLNQSALASLQNIVDSVNSTLQQMESALGLDNYLTVEYLITQVNVSINDLETEMEGATLQAGVLNQIQQTGIWFWVAVVVIIVFVLGFFVYMFLPSSGHEGGYHPEKGYAHPETGGKLGFASKLKKAFRRKKRQEQPASVVQSVQSAATSSSLEGNYESFHYSEGYRKEKPYNYEYSDAKGMKGLFQRLRRKKPGKEGKGPQMHLDQFVKSEVTQ